MFKNLKSLFSKGSKDAGQGETAVLEDSSSGEDVQIYIAREGEPDGPYSIADLERMFEEGTVSREDFAWYEGLEEWQNLGEMLHIETIEVLEDAAASQEEQPEATEESPNPEAPTRIDLKAVKLAPPPGAE